MCPLDLCFFQRTAAAAAALMMKPDHPSIISHIERSALSLRLSLNHQQYPEIYSCIQSCHAHLLFLPIFRRKRICSLHEPGSVKKTHSLQHMVVSGNLNAIMWLLSLV